MTALAIAVGVLSIVACVAVAYAMHEHSGRLRAEAVAEAAAREWDATDAARREATAARDAAHVERIRADAEAQARHDAAAARDPVEESNELLARLRRPR